MFLASDVECNNCLRVEAEFLVVFNLSLRSVVHNEVRSEVLEFFFARLDEHVGHEVCLPSYFNDEANSKTSVLVSTAETVNNEETLVRKLLLGKISNNFPSFFSHGVVVVLVFFRSPPYSVLRVFVENDELVLRRTTSVNTSHHIYSTEFGCLTFFITFKGSLSFFFEKLFVRRVVHDFSSAENTVLGKI